MLSPFERLETPRLILRKPRREDAQAIFDRYASDPAVTRLLAWPTHKNVADTRTFLEFSDAEWERHPAGPMLVESRLTGQLLGGTGLGFETKRRAAIGYVFAKDAWGKGYATEAVQSVVSISRQAGILRLYALTHPENAASSRVLEKCSFVREGVWRDHSEFPNLPDPGPLDVVCYAKIFTRVG